MSKTVQSVAFTGGQISSLATLEKGCECALALHRDRLLVKMLRVPADQDPVAVATPVLKAMSPFPDDPLAVSCETVREDDRERIVMAVAFPENAANDIGEALDAEKLSVTRIDAIVLGQLRNFCATHSELMDGKRRLIKFAAPDCLTLVVMDGDLPVSIRAMAVTSDEAEVKRETMLSLLEAEDFNGAKELAETVESEFTNDALTGIDDRTVDVASVNALPESWREVLEETRFKAKLIRGLAVAIGLWVLVMGTLFGVPVAYGYMTDRQKDMSRQHARQYRAVKDMKAKIDLVSEYSENARSALELMKAVSDRLPEGITLSSWDFRKGDTLRIAGDAEQSSDVLDFKDTMSELPLGDDLVFNQVQMGALSAQKDGRQRFAIELIMKSEDDVE